ncbi:acyl-CoA ligase (AMP-forming), exosortase A system-associated [Actinoplanes sp. TBRC 11911]|uniref:acyl-CoA ligase (AMP-forming), exosortase A system-associated n=1 Tax=Actinoplanes sp. TBRC 11911 TaxID=2729386 RepID=UPI00145F677A|nr:acyl-CoA ligase (AMP-forming), exosortase A system-associated [Actinoplanes sp. TBRC 11911]NMO49890.1 acyl-CoA ligase (AMP-forming), exosortase A system-associated [Actinoplanes sp. TBRC 11911]
MLTQLHHLIEQAARTWPDRPALTDRTSTVTYAELRRKVAEVASALHHLGVAPGDRVAVYLDKRIETVTAMFGASAAGAVFVPINPLLRPEQVAHLLDDCTVTVLVTSADRLRLLRDELEGCKSVEHVLLVGATPAESVAYRDGIDDDIAAIFYTSGSTGRPKGVTLTHRNLLAGAASVNAYLGNTERDVIAAVLPLSFDAGFSQLTTGFAAGAHVVLVNYVGPADVIRACVRHGVTALTCVPPLWIQLAEQEWPDAVRLRYFANTGGRLPRTTLDRLRHIFPEALPYLMYGLTEAFRSTYLHPSEVDRRPDSIGKAIPNAEILVVRPDGSPCDPGEPGELVHRGALVASGYWNDPDRTAERFRPAPGRPAELVAPELAVWSGDLAVRDDEGFLYFVGRTDDMIKTSGYRVSPTEVEEVAHGTGLVRDAVALGVDDERLGQHIVLVVSPPAGQALDRAGLLDGMRRRLPRYMVPQRVVVRDELPRSPNGKFDRAALRGEVA